MLIFPNARLMHAYAYDRIVRLAFNVPFLTMHIGAHSTKSTRYEIHLNAFVALCIHLAHFHCFIAYLAHNLKRIYVTVSDVICIFHVFLQVPSMG